MYKASVSLLFVLNLMERWISIREPSRYIHKFGICVYMRFIIQTILETFQS